MSKIVPLEGFGGGGGAALNFAVIGNPQPASAKENTIWVDTDIPIGAWSFSIDQPEDMVNGDLWFPIGSTGAVEFNALKKNRLMVCPLAAKQYIDGALVELSVKIYQGGQWLAWITYIYNGGWIAANDFVSVGAGQNGGAGQTSGLSGMPLIKVTYDDAGNIVLDRSTNWNGYCWVLTDVAFDLTGVNTVYCETADIGSGGTIKFGVGSVASNKPKASVALTASNTVYPLDVTTVNEEVQFGFFGGSGSADWKWNDRKIKAFWF